MNNRFALFLLIVLSAHLSAFSQGRILMIDDRVDSVSGVEFVYHQPHNWHANPVLKADRQWELNINGDPYAAPFSGGVWYDEEESVFKMWYSAGGGMPNGLVACYATSADGKHWDKPSLDIVPGTNIVDTLEHDCFTVLVDKHESDRSRRYKMFTVRFDTPSAVSMVLKYSSDGIHWSEPVAVSGDLFDRCSAFYDPFRKQYVLSLKTKDRNNLRARNYLAHPDPEMAVSLAHRVKNNVYDRNIRFWFSADADDPRHPGFPDIAPAVYNHDVIAYENLLLGQFNIWQGPENKDCVRLNVQKRNEILIGFSADGFNWNRECKTPFIPVDTSFTAWNAGNIQSSMGSPVIVGDSLYFYYSGRYNSRPEHASNFATGLTVMRRDGFVSADADAKGCLITAPVDVCGPYLYLNADVSRKGARLTVELLDENYNPIEGYSGKDCVALKDIDSTKIRYMWKNGRDACMPESGKVRVRFNLEKCGLYSFWFTPYPGGESRGYTAGGGPGLAPTGIDEPLPK